MSSILFYALLLLTVHLIVAGIILLNLGNKKKKKSLKITGAIFLAHSPVTLILGLIFATSISSAATLLLLFFFPIAVIIGLIVGITYSIIFLVEGFSKHITKKIATGFTMIGVIVTIVVVPIVLISIFGLPIALM